MNKYAQTILILFFVIAANVAFLFVYHSKYQVKIGVVDVDSVLEDHVKRYGSQKLEDNQRDLLATSFGLAMETELIRYKDEGYVIFVKRAFVKGKHEDLTQRLMDNVDAHMTVLLSQQGLSK